jgi:hypothetical protein
MVRLAQTVHLSCTNTNTISKQTKTRFDMTHVTWEFNQVRPKWLPRLWYTWHKPCTYHASRLALSPNGPKRASNWALSPRSVIGSTQNDYWAYATFYTNHAPILHWHLHRLQTDRNEIWHDPCHLGVLSGASKTFSKPMVRPVQTVYLSYVKIRTISKQTKTSFLLSLVTLEYHRLRLKRLLCLWYFWRKPCTYLELTLTPYPNGPKQDLTRPTSPRGFSGCVQNDLQAYGMFSAHHEPIFRQD